MAHQHTCKHNGVKWEGTEVCEACKLYDTLVKRADAASTCPYKHHCERHSHIMSAWYGEQEEQADYNLPKYPTLSLEENGKCLVCDAYDKRKQANAQGVCRPFLVVAWGISRHYGGPEEGGWWYDWTEVVEVRRAHTWQEGLRQARELKEKYPQPRFNRFSCANRGEDDTFIGLFYGENDPRFPQNSTQRPHYE